MPQLPLLIDPKRGIYKSDHSDAFYSTGPYFWGISIPMWYVKGWRVFGWWG